jgi:hypothetical protein
VERFKRQTPYTASEGLNVASIAKQQITKRTAPQR